MTRKRSSHKDDRAPTMTTIGLGCQWRRDAGSLRTRYPQKKPGERFRDRSPYYRWDTNSNHRLNRVGLKTRLILGLSQFADGLELKLDKLLKAKPSFFDSAHFNYADEGWVSIKLERGRYVISIFLPSPLRFFWLMADKPLNGIDIPISFPTPCRRGNHNLNSCQWEETIAWKICGFFNLQSAEDY